MLTQRVSNHHHHDHQGPTFSGTLSLLISFQLFLSLLKPQMETDPCMDSGKPIHIRKHLCRFPISPLSGPLMLSLSLFVALSYFAIIIFHSVSHHNHLSPCTHRHKHIRTTLHSVHNGVLHIFDRDDDLFRSVRRHAVRSGAKHLHRADRCLRNFITDSHTFAHLGPDTLHE